MFRTEAWLNKWFVARGAGVLGLDENYFDAGAIDSFGVIELIEAVESHYGISFRQHDFQDRRFPTIRGLAEILGDRIAEHLERERLHQG